MSIPATEKRCTDCKEIKPVADFYMNKLRNQPESLCKSCRIRRAEEWRRRPENIARQRQQQQARRQAMTPEERRLAKILQRYKLTGEAYAALMEKQDSRCAICRRLLVEVARVCVDHDHRCCPRNASDRFSCGNCVRGLLCGECNSFIALAKEDPDRLRRAADYVETPPARTG